MTCLNDHPRLQDQLVAARARILRRDAAAGDGARPDPPFVVAPSQAIRPLLKIHSLFIIPPMHLLPSVSFHCTPDAPTALKVKFTGVTQTLGQPLNFNSL
jgi:hypothetical protein